MAEQIDADIAALRGDLGKMRSDFAELSETLQRLTRHGVSETFDKVMKSAESNREKIEKAGQSLIEEIEERPVAAAVIAFIAGMVLAALIGRRS